CPICTEHSMADIAANETLLAEHNLHVCFAAVREVRRAIAQGDLWELVERRARAHPALLGALRELRQHNAFLEESEPISRRGALYYVGPETAHRPILHRFRRRAIERYRPPPSKGLLVLPERGRPFSETFAPILSQVLPQANVHAVVKSLWGPVPIELDHVWPMSQSIVPERPDIESLEAAEVFFREWAAGAGFDFGVLWEGPSTLEELQARAPGGRVPDWKALRVGATAEFQFGLGAADALLRGLISYVVSKNNGKVRNVLADGEHVLSLRAEDGLFTLKAAGARRLRPRPRRGADARQVVVEGPEQAHRAFGGGFCDERASPPGRAEVAFIVEGDGRGDGFGRCGVVEGQGEARDGLHADSPGQIRTAVAGSKDPNA